MTTTTEGPYRDRTTIVEEPPVAVDAVRRPAYVEPGGEVRTVSERRFSLDALIAAIAGVVLLVVGLIAITRGGFDGEMATPVVKVANYTHTTTLGLIEIGFGLCLLIAAAARSRTFEILVGGALGVAAFVGAVQTDSFRHSLALESDMAWIAVGAGAVIVLAALLLPRYAHRSVRVTPV